MNRSFGPFVNKFKDAVVAHIVETFTSPVSKLSKAELGALYDIVIDENEGFDGEAVEIEFMSKMMASRYRNLGLAPSRN